MIRHIFFDLDGTLTDSGLGIINSISYALEKMQYKLPEAFDKRRFIGPPLTVSFREFCGFQGEDIERAIEYYREYFSVKGIFENEVYPGIIEMLEKLKNLGYKMYVTTSKPEVFARRITDHFDLSKYFEFVAGSLLSGERDKKHEVIEYVLKEYNIKDTKSVIMVGDRSYDVTGAAEFNIKTIGVLFGYGSRQEFEKAGAWKIAKDVAELEYLIINNN